MIANEWVELFGDNFIKADGSKVGKEVFEGRKYVALYFSAHWCGPCRAYTPMLASVYPAISKDVVIIFVSRDKDEEAFKDYFKDMPWYSVNYTDARRLGLHEKYKCGGIPTLSLFNAKGEMIRQEADPDVDQHGEGVVAVWDQI